MKNDVFVEKVGEILKVRKISSAEIEQIKKDVSSLLGQYKISHDLRKLPRPKNNNKSYRVRYKIYDEKKGYWVQFETIKAGGKAADARELVKEEFPSCRVTSAWLIN